MVHEDNSAQPEISMSGSLTPSDKEAHDYMTLPFEMPSGIARIDVSYDYTRTTSAQSRRGDENVLDLGILGPDRESRVTDDFRGWSGGARSSFFIAEDSATPGYTPGNLAEGTWRVLLGLYRIAATGCDYTITVRFSTAESDSVTHDSVPLQSGSSTRSGRSADGESWYVGDLQSHTRHSDARATVAQLAMVARHRGLDFLAVTDHNTVSHHRELAVNSSPSLLLVPGMEITTYYGHANVWGLREWIDFRFNSPTQIARTVEQAHEQGALFSVNHPHTDCPWEYGWIDGIDSIEVWQGLWNEANLAAVAWWDSLLSRGIRVVGVGGSDRHEPDRYDPYFPLQVGKPSTRVRARSLQTTDILSGIREGKVAIAADPEGPWLELESRTSDGTTCAIGETAALARSQSLRVNWSVTGAAGDALELVSMGEVVHRCRIETDHEAGEFSYDPTGSGYVRAQIIAADNPDGASEEYYPRILAIANPIFYERSREW